MTAEELLLQRALRGRIQVRREQEADGLYLVFWKGTNNRIDHQVRFKLEDDTLTHVDDPDA